MPRPSELRRSAAILDGDAAWIGLRMLGGDVRAFYRLSLAEQVDVLAVLQNERRPPERASKVHAANDAAAEFWGFATGGPKHAL